MCIFSVNNITVPGTAKIWSNFQNFDFLLYCLAKMYGQIFKISIFYRTVWQKNTVKFSKFRFSTVLSVKKGTVEFLEFFHITLRRLNG